MADQIVIPGAYYAIPESSKLYISLYIRSLFGSLLAYICIGAVQLSEARTTGMPQWYVPTVITLV